MVDALGALSGDLAGKYYPLKSMKKEQEEQMIKVTCRFVVFVSAYTFCPVYAPRKPRIRTALFTRVPCENHHLSRHGDIVMLHSCTVVETCSCLSYSYSITPSLFHSRLETSLFRKSSFLTQPSVSSWFRFPDCLPILLRISVFLRFTFSVFQF